MRGLFFVGPGGLLEKEEDGKKHERSEEHTSELQSRLHLVCRLLLEKKTNHISDHSLQNGLPAGGWARELFYLYLPDIASAVHQLYRTVVNCHPFLPHWCQALPSAPP